MSEPTNDKQARTPVSSKGDTAATMSPKQKGHTCHQRASHVAKGSFQFPCRERTTCRHRKPLEASIVDMIGTTGTLRPFSNDLSIYTVVQHHRCWSNVDLTTNDKPNVNDGRLQWSHASNLCAWCSRVAQLLESGARLCPSDPVTAGTAPL